MKKVYFLATLVASLGILAPGCANFASFQEPDTMAAGQSRSGVGATFSYYDVDGESVSIPALNGWFRYGLMEKLEVHTMVWIPLGATIGAKYQLLGDRLTPGPSVSVGLDFGYLQITSGEAPNETSTTIYDTYLPVYLGYRMSPGFSVYAVPKYLLRFVTDEVGSEAAHTVGTALGVALGEQGTLHLEGVALYDGDGVLFTSGIGYAF